MFFKLNTIRLITFPAIRNKIAALHSPNKVHNTIKKSIVYGLFLILTFPILALAENNFLPKQISFQHLLKNKDIVLGEVAAIFQDKDGFMWFGGANALIRYDGYEFRQVDITTEVDGGTKLVPVNPVADIYQDSQGIIWISTRNGLLFYDPLTEILKRIENDVNQILPITSIDILESLELPSGELISASNDGLLIVDRKSKTYKLVVADENISNGLHSSRVRSLHIASDGGLWVGTNAGLENINWATMSFTLHKPYPDEPELIPENSVADIAEELDGTFWLATSNGLIQYNPQTQRRQRFTHEASNALSLSGNDIWNLQLDSQGALWIASDGGGISILEKHADENYSFNNQVFDPSRESSISSNQVRVVFEDNNHDIWIGNYPSGINFFDRSSAGFTTYKHDPANPNSLSHNSVLSMKEDAKGNFWLGTDGGGLNYFDRDQNTFKAFKNIVNDDTSISSNAILTTFLDSDNKIWVGTWGGGISIYDSKSNQFTRLPYDELRTMSPGREVSDRLNNAHVWSIKEDKNKDLWIATHAGGLSKYDRKSKTYTHYWHDASNSSSITSAIVWDTFEDSKNNFWVATSTGLNLMNRKAGTFKRFLANADDPTSLSNPSVLSIHEDRKKQLWFGTDDGLNLLNKDGKSFTVFKRENGFNNATIRQILEDNTGKFWLSTNNGVSLFDPDTKKIKNYNRESGNLVGSFHTDSGLISTKGEIVFGGVNGLRFYNPEKLVENSTIPPIVFTDFKIFADSIHPGSDDGILSKSINKTLSITLDYKKSMFVFEFSALNFRDSGKNRYSYKLEGFDTEWLDAGTQRQAKYTNLNSGSYTFHVRGSNNDGAWNTEGKSISIVQLPPPWLTWWAFCIYGLSILAIILWFIHHQRQKRKIIEEQNRLLETQVFERTAELRQKNDDIQAMLENMPQGLFTVQANEMIHSEYSHYLEAIFETTEIANRKVSDLLFCYADVGPDTLDSFRAAISAIISEDEMCFGFNSPLLISDYQINIKGRTKYLSLDWNPIAVNGTVHKLMVSVRDVTQLREIESEAAGQKRELDIIRQLLNLSSEKFLSFEESSTRYINDNRQVIEAHQEKNIDAIALLYRNMHTIKGNCRTYGFGHLSDIVHEVESTYSSLRSHADFKWETEALLDDLDGVEQGLAEYSDVYRRVLGRGDSSKKSRQNGFWMETTVMQKIESHAQKGQSQALLSYIQHIQSKPIENILVDVIASLSSIAEQLDKPTPIVKINANNIRIKNTSFELLTDVSAHILRNCIDHGIESSDERLIAGKTQQGNILITATAVKDRLNIFINDDGRGINISRLFTKGIELGRWKESDTPSNQDIAELIFCSGVSTKDVVSDISGRGVGLDAVKQFLAGQGGNVQIILQNTWDKTGGFVPFELFITLPDSEYIVVDNNLS